MQKEGEEEKKERIRMRRRKDNQQRKSQKREPMSAKGLGTGADFLMNEVSLELALKGLPLKRRFYIYICICTYLCI